jgi:hypothetical protein
LYQVWDQTDGGKNIRGCGTIWLPTTTGTHTLEISVWKPQEEGLNIFSGTVILI